jgi:hypothetical protein
VFGFLIIVSQEPVYDIETSNNAVNGYFISRRVLANDGVFCWQNVNFFFISFIVDYTNQTPDEYYNSSLMVVESGLG